MTRPAHHPPQLAAGTKAPNFASLFASLQGRKIGLASLLASLTFARNGGENSIQGRKGRKFRDLLTCRKEKKRDDTPPHMTCPGFCVFASLASLAGRKPVAGTASTTSLDPEDGSVVPFGEYVAPGFRAARVLTPDAHDDAHDEALVEQLLDERDARARFEAVAAQ